MEQAKQLMDATSYNKMQALENPYVEKIIEKYAILCKPHKITVLSDSEEDRRYVKHLSIKNNEERLLHVRGHTIHFDGYYDQGRDKKNTKILVRKGVTISKYINSGDRETCLQEMWTLLDGIMEGKEMLVKFYCLGPQGSRFSLLALQLTDSAYVSHAEDILYRQGYCQFKKMEDKSSFFHFVHAAGELDTNHNSKNINKRRIYVDLEENRVFTVNNQYAGNSVGLKKLALRLAIKKSHQEDWLTEHMFIMGVNPEGKNRTTYFTGAFPSGCGKTSTAMIPGQSIIGDDIAYLKPGADGRAYATNVEQGIFGIIMDVNPDDDPVIYKTITSPREIIFSNVLVKEGKPYWLNMGKELPDEGINFSGSWEKGKTDKEGNKIPPAHKNARYCLRIEELPNVDAKLNDPRGVPVSGIIYGGRDSDTSPAVLESLSWAHGVFIGATLESETTATTLGTEGVRKHSPMANLDFLVIPLSTYIKNHLEFGEELDRPPRIFATNYFLKEDGLFLNRKVDKKVWLMWMEGRVHGEYDAIETPIGYLPRHEDLKVLFRQIFGKEYTILEYEKQFSLRVPKLLARLDRILTIYRGEEGIPDIFFHHIQQQKERLLEAREKYNKDLISPLDLE